MLPEPAPLSGWQQQLFLVFLYCCFSLCGERYPPVGRWSPQHGVLHPLKHNSTSVSFLSQAIRPIWVLKCFLVFISSASSCPGVLKVSSAGAEMMGRRKRCSPSSQATSHHSLWVVSVVLTSAASQVPGAFASLVQDSLNFPHASTGDALAAGRKKKNQLTKI